MRKKPNILLVNPPIHDFSAYDFWLKPYGLLRAGGMLREIAHLHLFDYLDRYHPAFDPSHNIKTNQWGCGGFPNKRIERPASLQGIHRYFRRFGIDRAVFQEVLRQQDKFDYVLIGTVMTYWYPAYQEVIEDVRRFCPEAKIVLGGFYATACCEHARRLDVDAVVSGDDFSPLWDLLDTEPGQTFQLPAWELYPTLKTGVMKLTKGCPFRCGYCYVPQSGVRFQTRPLDDCLTELEQLIKLGAAHIAFYDDALLFEPERILTPFLEEVIRRKTQIHFHTPNALHARFMTADMAKLMVAAGVKTFYLGFESQSEAFHGDSGPGKVVSRELAAAVENLKSAGVDPAGICAYEMVGHPRTDQQQLEESMRFANSLGIRVMLSDFSPIPGTPDGDLCGELVDLSEPINHNKSVFPERLMGFEGVNHYKNLCRMLNTSL